MPEAGRAGWDRSERVQRLGRPQGPCILCRAQGLTWTVLAPERALETLGKETTARSPSPCSSKSPLGSFLSPALTTAFRCFRNLWETRPVRGPNRLYWGRALTSLTR